MISIKYDDFGENYDLFVRLCEMTSEPVKLVKEGSPDLIVQSAGAYERRRKILDLREKLIRTGEQSVTEVKSVSLKELSKYIDEIESKETES